MGATAAQINLFCQTPVVLRSTWCRIPDGTLDRAAQVLPFVGSRCQLWLEGEGLGFAKYGDEWEIIEHVWQHAGLAHCTGGAMGGCMAKAKVTKVLRKLIRSGPTRVVQVPDYDYDERHPA